MTIDWDKPIETVEGHPARVLSQDYIYSGKRLTVIQFKYSNHSMIGYYHQNGKPAFGSPEIRNRKVKREGWVNVYPGGGVSDAYETESLAKDAAANNVLATIKIEWGE